VRLALLIGLLLLAALPAAATADDPNDPYAEYAVPFDGYRHPVSSWPNATSFEMFSFTIYAEFEAGEFQIEVATSPDTDPDETLADANRVDAYVAPLDPRVTEDVFSARTRLDAQWLGTVGTYYWQAYRIDSGYTYATPIQRIFITERPPPDPPSDPPLERSLPTQPVSSGVSGGPAVVAPTAKRLSRTSARAILSRAIRTQAGRRPQKLTSSCTLPTPFLAKCSLTWRDARYRYKVKARLTSSTGGMLAKLDGTRTRRDCARRCRSAIHWSIATTGWFATSPAIGERLVR
jgi:hypothetical protein